MSPMGRGSTADGTRTALEYRTGDGAKALLTAATKLCSATRVTTPSLASGEVREEFWATCDEQQKHAGGAHMHRVEAQARLANINTGGGAAVGVEAAAAAPNQ